MVNHELEEMEVCDCCGEEFPPMTLVDCEQCTHYACPDCMWRDQVCKCHLEGE